MNTVALSPPESPLESIRTPARPLVGVAVLLVWVGLMCALFWWFQYRFTSTWVTFDGTEVAEIQMEEGSRTVVHFVDQGCSCTKFSLPHIQDLEDQWQSSNVTFRTLTPDDSNTLSLRLSGKVPASPAVAMWGIDGELVYFGPYSSGSICGEGEDLLSKLLVNETEGQWTSQESVGCFCPWPT